MSVLWDYFVVSLTDHKFAVCNTCGEDVPRGGKVSKTFNTTNLAQHLKSHHKTEHAEYLRKRNDSKEATDAQKKKLTQPTLKAAFKAVEPFSSGSKKAKEIDKTIMEFIALDHQPLSVVQDRGFKRLVSKLEPRYKIPGRKYLTDVALPALYETVYSHVHSLIEHNATAVSFKGNLLCF